MRRVWQTRDMHELIRLKETESVLLNAEMMLRASLIKRSLAAGHFREDFPRKTTLIGSSG